MKGNGLSERDVWGVGEQTECPANWKLKRDISLKHVPVMSRCNLLMLLNGHLANVPVSRRTSRKGYKRDTRSGYYRYPVVSAPQFLAFMAARKVPSPPGYSPSVFPSALSRRPRLPHCAIVWRSQAAPARNRNSRLPGQRDADDRPIRGYGNCAGKSRGGGGEAAEGQ
jgi:hypothetical protein